MLLMEKSTISMAIFHSFLLVYQAGYPFYSGRKTNRSPKANWRLLHVFDEAGSQILEIRLVFYCLPPKHRHGISMAQIEIDGLRFTY